MAVTFINNDPADKYEVSPKAIGQGGMGTIYVATDRQNPAKMVCMLVRSRKGGRGGGGGGGREREGGRERGGER